MHAMDFHNEDGFVPCAVGRTVVPTEEDLPELQALMESNAAYYLMASGALAAADEARQAFDEMPPAGMPYGAIWHWGLREASTDRLIGYANVVSDFLAPGVWHIGLFMVDGDRHGRGVGRAWHDALVETMHRRGARWIRLGVIDGYALAQFFWAARGYVLCRKRHNVVLQAATGHTVTLCTLVRLPREEGLPEYLSHVQRDRPESD